MANIKKVIEKTNIPYGKYCVDSFKLLIDSSCFTKINIPKDYLLIDKETGDVLREFKANSLLLEYNGNNVYLGVFRKVLRGRNIDKVFIYFTSKIANNYFNGITKETVLKVLEFLREIGRLEFSDTLNIYNALYVKDLDIKIDHVIKRKHITQIEDWQTRLKNYFAGEASLCMIYNSQEKGLGLQCNHRDRSTITKPYMKFYHKSRELRGKSSEFFKTLPKEIQAEVIDNFIYRYEFTLKDKKYCEKFNISNRLADTLEVAQEKWKEVGQYFFNVNFGLVPKRIIDVGKMTTTDHILAIMFKRLLDKGETLQTIQSMFMQTNDSKNCNGHRVKKRFDKISSAIFGEHKEQIQNDIEFIDEISSFLGFTPIQPNKEFDR